jgi:PAS domain S-box-containing protein
MFGVIQDVTEPTVARRDLEKSTTLLEEAERLAHLGSWEWDVSRGVTSYSDEWQRIYGVDRSEIPVDEGLELVHPADRPVVAEAIERVLTGGGRYHAEYRIIRRDDGEVRHLEGFGRPVLGDDGTVDRVYGATLDVTERVVAQEALLEGKRRLRRTLGATVAALATTTEMRDPYTAGHQHRVAELSVGIGQLLGWDLERVEDVRIAALLHDIGKVVVPAEILTKPGRLSDSEFALIKGHAAAAGEILAGIEWVGPITQTVVQHHERLDGSGYPAGLRGDEIIPEARVLAVADVFEAMVSHRPYRPALPYEAAADELRGGAGIRYDSESVAACLHLIEDGFAFSTVQQ